MRNFPHLPIKIPNLIWKNYSPNGHENGQFDHFDKNGQKPQAIPILTKKWSFLAFDQK